MQTGRGTEGDQLCRNVSCERVEAQAIAHVTLLFSLDTDPVGSPSATVLWPWQRIEKRVRKDGRTS